ncbi:MAG: putative manganese-dependent inorganic diphosphatase [Clostridiaceae bacterium]
MKDVIYVSGHKNPDSDSICAALAYSELKNKLATGKKYLPIRLGSVSRETQFILDYFNVKAPKLVDTVKPRISDLEIDKVTPVSPEISLKTAWSMIKDKDVNTLPVVNEDNKLTGIVAVANLTSSYMDVWDNKIIAKSNATLNNILDTLNGKVIYQSSENPKFQGKLVVAAMQPESAEEHIEANDIAICGDRKDVQITITNSNASLMIITGGHEVDEDVIEAAKANGTTIVVTPYDTFTTSRLVIQSIPVNHVMTKEGIISFKDSDLIEDVREVMLQTRHRKYPVLDDNNHVVGLISRYHLISNKKQQIILVDHNEKTQAVDGIGEAEILEIIDHHRVANIETSNPIYYRCEPVGSTSTIVANLYFDNGITPSKEVAGLLAGALISDTLLLKSPTTTTTDKVTLKRLVEIADINAEEFAAAMFKAGTSLVGKTLEEIFYQDYKTFVINNKKVAVAQVNTMDIEGFEPMKSDMLGLMEKTAESQGFNLILLLLTDIYNESSLLLAVGSEKEVVNTVFNVTLKDNCAFAPGIVSRKKQVIPPLTSALENLK